MCTHRRVVAILVAVVVTVTMVYASAASLGGVTPRNLGAGGTVVLSCDTDGVTVSYTVSGGLVTDVTVSGIAATCNGGLMRLTLSDSSGASIGSGGPTTVTGTSHVLAMSPQPSASSVTAVHIVIEGP